MVALGRDDVSEMLALVTAAQPGPFEKRTVEFGGYLGIRIGGRLVAMAGERLRPPGYTEISAVATDPDFRRLGLARRLVAAVADRVTEAGDTPFLHAMAGNTDVIRLMNRWGSPSGARHRSSCSRHRDDHRRRLAAYGHGRPELAADQVQRHQGSVPPAHPGGAAAVGEGQGLSGGADRQGGEGVETNQIDRCHPVPAAHIGDCLRLPAGDTGGIAGHRDGHPGGHLRKVDGRDPADFEVGHQGGFVVRADDYGIGLGPAGTAAKGVSVETEMGVTVPSW